MLFNKNALKLGAAVQLKRYSEEDSTDAQCIRRIVSYAAGSQTSLQYRCEKK